MARFQRRPRFCKFTAGGIESIDYKDVELLLANTSDTGKILARRNTGTKSHFQRQLARAVKRARFLALIPYTDQHDQ